MAAGDEIEFYKTFFSFISNLYLSWSLLKGEIHLKSGSIIFHHLSQRPRLCEEGGTVNALFDLISDWQSCPFFLGLKDQEDIYSSK